MSRGDHSPGFECFLNSMMTPFSYTDSRKPGPRRRCMFLLIESWDISATGRRFRLGSRSSLPSFPSVQGLFAPGRISLEIPSTSLTSWKLNKSPSGTFSSFM